MTFGDMKVTYFLKQWHTMTNAHGMKTVGFLCIYGIEFKSVNTLASG